jgi:hypothetical protein
MSDPRVYPESPNGPLTLLAATGIPAPTFAGIEQLAAPDPSTPNILRTMFIRVAMSGANCTGVNSATAPNFYLRADDGDAVLINDHAQPPNRTYPIFHRPGSNPVDFVGEGSVFLEDHNVFRLLITFANGTSNHAWQLGIWNNDATAARQFTWVVSGTLANTAQPWIDVTPAALSWDVLTETAEAKSVTVSNKGTTAFTVTGVTPALPSGFELVLPGAINPNTSAPLVVRFFAPATPPPFLAAIKSFVVTPPDSTAGEDAGHNHKFELRVLVSSPNIWREKSSMATGRTRLGLAGASNGKLYAAGGAILGDPALKAMEEYDPTTDIWTTKAPMPTARKALRLAAAIDGRLYAVGGGDSNVEDTEFPVFGTVEAYDPVTDTWTTRAPMQIARKGFGLAAANNGKLYAVGGVDEELRQLASLEEYDPATNRWTTKAPMPIRREMYGLAAAPNGRLYAFGVLLNTVWSAPTVDEYDPQTNSWVTKASGLTVRNRFEVATADNGKIYVVGGQDRFTTVGTMDEYDPATDVWTPKAAMPTKRSGHAFAAAKNGKLYAVGGDAAGEDEDTVEEYTPDR